VPLILQAKPPRQALVLISVFAIFFLIFARKSDAGICCVSCNGTTTCGCGVNTSCGSCCTSDLCCGGGSGESVIAEIPAHPDIFELRLSVGKLKPALYRIEGSDGLEVKDNGSGASYVISPALNQKDERVVDVTVKRRYSLLGWRLLVDYASVQVKRGAANRAPVRVGPFFIWSIEYGRSVSS
jgi:hypothetical protein